LSRTLFWYLFRELAWVFLLAAITLTGIMSFGGLLKPLTRHGLDLLQVIRMVACLMPAMMTYSVPVAALFATTIVYGRLSADNELTACRAAGIGYLTIALPALALGLLVSIGSLLLLFYIVPYYSLAVERVVYANVAKYVANEIQRSHEFRLVRGGTSIFAQQAYVPEQQGSVQTVVLVAPTIVTRQRDPEEEDKRFDIPRTFAMARKAVVRITQNEETSGEMMLEADLEGGILFYRQSGERPQAGVGQTVFGPIPIPSLIGENVKFMNLRRLEQLAADPERSQRVRQTLDDFIAAEQEDVLLRNYRSRLESGRSLVIKAGEEIYEIRGGGSPRYARRQVTVESTPRSQVEVVRKLSDGRVDLAATAQSLTLRAEAQNPIDRVIVHMELRQAQLRIRQDELDKELHVMAASTPLSHELARLRQRKASHYFDSGYLPARRTALLREYTMARNDAIAELHGRAAFAVSCLVLVALGCGIGMTFRSADFVSAFAVCVIPAIISITLVVAGQQMAVELPRNYSAESGNPLTFGLSLIWAGNAVVAILAVGVLKRLHRH
jgi:lipopolysaccharide export LptBFGC system permease protein LptF